MVSTEALFEMIQKAKPVMDGMFMVEPSILYCEIVLIIAIAFVIDIAVSYNYLLFK